MAETDAVVQIHKTTPLFFVRVFMCRRTNTKTHAIGEAVEARHARAAQLTGVVPNAVLDDAAPKGEVGAPNAGDHRVGFADFVRSVVAR